MEKRLIRKYQLGGYDEVKKDNTYVASKPRLIPKRKQSKPLFTQDEINFKHYVDFVNQHEGIGITNNKDDRGGLTNTGITLPTWKTLGYDKNKDGIIDESDLIMLTPEDRTYVIRKFWEMSSADKIKDPRLAMYVTDYFWGSGGEGFKEMHKAFGLKPRTSMSTELLNKINSDPKAMEKLHNSRTSFYRRIAVGNQRKWLNGWLNRANDLYNA